MKELTHNDLSELVNQRLVKSLPEIQRQFANPPTGFTRHAVIDNLLPDDIARTIYESFPKAEDMRLMKTFREQKYTSKSLGKFAPVLREITFAFQDSEVLRTVERCTGLSQQHPDPNLYAGGLSLMTRGHYLWPHLDNSHDGELRYYRTLNLLYYASPNWKLENGGNLQLWNTNVTENITLPSLFNRLILMETNKSSWHSVSRLEVDQPRICVSNYYFSPLSPTGQDYFHITAFNAPPQEKMMRLWCGVDNHLRTMIRWVAPKGLGKRDVYSPNLK